MELKEYMPLQDFLGPLFAVFVQQYFPASKDRLKNLESIKDIKGAEGINFVLDNIQHY